MRPPKKKQPQVKKGLCRVLEHVDVDVEGRIEPDYLPSVCVIGMTRGRNCRWSGVIEMGGRRCRWSRENHTTLNFFTNVINNRRIFQTAKKRFRNQRHLSNSEFNWPPF